MNIFPLLRTERLILRKIQVDDLNALMNLANNRKITDEILNFPYPYRDIDASMRMGYVNAGFKEGKRFVFAIALKETNELVGEVALHIMDKDTMQAQLAYWIGEPHWNNGYATEACAAAIKFGFEALNCQLIYAECRASNLASNRVLQKLNIEKMKRNGSVIVYAISKQLY